MAQPESAFLALRERAVALVASAAAVSEDELLRHVYGGLPLAAVRDQLLGPLLGDPRLQRLPDGRWTMPAQPGQPQPIASAAFTALALTTTGPNPARARVLKIAALQVEHGEVVGRFSALLNPGRRVPRYALARVGVGADVLDELPTFEAIFDELERFSGLRPICAQEAQLAWAFLSAEAHRLGRALVEPLLLDVNELANRLLDVPGKLTLGLIAQTLGLGFTRLEDADEEARVVSVVTHHLLRSAAKRGMHDIGELQSDRAPTSPLRKGSTARALPDTPGVYVMHDAQQAPLYVGKARRLRSRMAAYVHRQLGATRRLEGLANAVHGVDARMCETDLEALVLEEREIRRLQPRFNTARQQRAPRAWLRLPPQPVDVRGTRARAAARLERVSGPEAGAGDYLGPFRSEAVAEQARELARAVFELDALRRVDRERYVEQLAYAWAFLNGSGDDALAAARRQHAQAVASGDTLHVRLCEQRLRAVRDYDLAAMLLPADPRHAGFAVVRPGPSGVEGFLLQAAVLTGFTTLADDDCHAFAQRLLAQQQPRTESDDVSVVMRWLGAQRSTARLVALPRDDRVAQQLIAAAAAAVMAG
jgi:DNA polymerase III epsilon subunit-like protein